ncbi:hypothetical protein D3C80_2053210 [compost metagenome]
MHVQLADDIAQGRNIELVRIERVLEHLRKRRRLLPQLLLFGDIQLKYLTDSLTTRYQDKPGIIRIVGQQ